MKMTKFLLLLGLFKSPELFAGQIKRIDRSQDRILVNKVSTSSLKIADSACVFLSSGIDFSCGSIVGFEKGKVIVSLKTRLLRRGMKVHFIPFYATHPPSMASVISPYP